MKGRVLKLGLLLVIGAIINIAVAWRCSMHYEISLKPLTSFGDGETLFIECNLCGVSLSERNLDTGSWDSATWSVRQNIEAGIPLTAMWGSRTVQNCDTVKRQFLLETTVGNTLRSVPCGILLYGFAINTIFYAAIVWLLFFAPFELRRRRRIKRGLCPKCAYDLRGGSHAVCPECGT